MTLQEKLNLAIWGRWLISLSIALISLFVGLRLRHVLVGVVVGAVAGWIAANVIQNYAVIPIMDEIWATGLTGFHFSPDGTVSEGDIAGNVFVLLFGWVCPLILLLIVLLVRSLWNRLRPLARTRTTEKA